MQLLYRVNILASVHCSVQPARPFQKCFLLSLIALQRLKAPSDTCDLHKLLSLSIMTIERVQLFPSRFHARSARSHLLAFAFGAVALAHLVLVAYRLRSKRGNSWRDRDRLGVDRVLSRQMEEAAVDGDGDEVAVLLLAAAANSVHHGECLWKSASKALICKHVSSSSSDP